MAPNYDAVCFHAQQTIERLLMGLLIHHSVNPQKIHDLAQLSLLVTQALPEWTWPDEELRFLSRAALDFRYPGESANREEAAEAFAISARIRKAILPLFA